MFDDFDTNVDVEAVYQEDALSHDWQEEVDEDALAVDLAYESAKDARYTDD